MTFSGSMSPVRFSDTRNSRSASRFWSAFIQ